MVAAMARQGHQPVPHSGRSTATIPIVHVHRGCVMILRTLAELCEAIGGVLAREEKLSIIPPRHLQKYPHTHALAAAADTPASRASQVDVTTPPPARAPASKSAADIKSCAKNARQSDPQKWDLTDVTKNARVRTQNIRVLSLFLCKDTARKTADRQPC